MEKSDKVVGLIDAYNALSQEAFAVWMRLHVAAEDQLKHRGKVAQMIGYSEGRSNEILRELRFAGYVSCTPGERPGMPTTVILERRCKIPGKTQFVRL